MPGVEYWKYLNQQQHNQFINKKISDWLEYSREGDARCSAAAVGPRGGDLLSSWGHRPTLTAASASRPTPPQRAGGRGRNVLISMQMQMQMQMQMFSMKWKSSGRFKSISVTVKSCFEIREGQIWFYCKNTPQSNTPHISEVAMKLWFRLKIS